MCVVFSSFALNIHNMIKYSFRPNYRSIYRRGIAPPLPCGRRREILALRTAGALRATSPRSRREGKQRRAPDLWGAAESRLVYFRLGSLAACSIQLTWLTGHGFLSVASLTPRLWVVGLNPDAEGWAPRGGGVVIPSPDSRARTRCPPQRRLVRREALSGPGLRELCWSLLGFPDKAGALLAGPRGPASSPRHPSSPQVRETLFGRRITSDAQGVDIGVTVPSYLTPQDRRKETRSLPKGSTGFGARRK